ncbi:MAG: YitT family protein [Clostridia bacterium]|nr:YitT family protein [Clostridia bacterium]
MKTRYRIPLALLGAFIQAMGLCNIHAFASVTEGGVLGATLLIDHWLHISPAVSAFVLNALCYLIGWRTLGRGFLLYSVLCGTAYSVFYAALAPFAPLWPELIALPLWSAVVGAVFIGIGAGLCVRVGGAPGGDDALAMALSKLTGLGVQWIYLFTDALVLGLSLSYIPLSKLAYSLLTVVLSGQMIGWLQPRRPSAQPAPQQPGGGLDAD